MKQISRLELIVQEVLETEKRNREIPYYGDDLDKDHRSAENAMIDAINEKYDGRVTLSNEDLLDELAKTPSPYINVQALVFERLYKEELERIGSETEIDKYNAWKRAHKLMTEPTPKGLGGFPETRNSEYSTAVKLAAQGNKLNKIARYHEEWVEEVTKFGRCKGLTDEEWKLTSQPIRCVSTEKYSQDTDAIASFEIANSSRYRYKVDQRSEDALERVNAYCQANPLHTDDWVPVGIQEVKDLTHGNTEVSTGSSSTESIGNTIVHEMKTGYREL